MNQENRMPVGKSLYMVLAAVLAADLPMAVFCALAGLGHGFMSGLTTSQMNRFFSDVSLWLEGPEAGGKTVIGSLLLFAGVVILQYVFIAVQNGAIEVLTFRVTGRLYEKLQECFRTVEALSFESSGFLNEAEKAENGIEDIAFLWNVILVTITAQIPYFVYMTLFMGKLDPALTGVIFLVFLPVAFSQVLRLKLYGHLNDESAVYGRRYKSYEACIHSREFFKETRLLGAAPYFTALFTDTIRLYDDKKWKTAKRAGLYELLLKGITLAGYFSVMCLFFRSLMGGRITVSAFAALITSLYSMFTTMEQMVCQYMGRISENMGNIRAYAGFLDRCKKGNGREAAVFETDRGLEIQLEGVSFRYPGMDRDTLRQLNLQVEAGSLVAIVGENGAGKSTLTKVLLGVYRPTEGVMKVNGKDMDEIGGLSGYTSVVSQNYQKYAMTLQQNVLLSDTEKTVDPGYIEKLLRRAGITPEKYPQGMETMLSREYNGIDLSGGEWQKTAIARGMYKDCSLLVLDEPTAAIDPLEEAKLYDLFRKMAEGRTAILVTHRLAAARIADRILVMEDGRIVEDGSHEALLMRNGIYAELFEKQKSMY